MFIGSSSTLPTLLEGAVDIVNDLNWRTMWCPWVPRVLVSSVWQRGCHRVPPKHSLSRLIGNVEWKSPKRSADSVYSSVLETRDRRSVLLKTKSVLVLKSDCPQIKICGVVGCRHSPRRKGKPHVGNWLITGDVRKRQANGRCSERHCVSQLVVPASF